MLCASFSDKYVRFGQLIKQENKFSINVIGEKTLPFQFDESLFENPKATQMIKSVFTQIRGDLSVQEKYLSLSIPSTFFNISINEFESSLTGMDIEEALNWSVKTRLGSISEKNFTQHYPLEASERENVRKYMTVSYFKEVRKILFTAAKSAGFNIDLLDINIFCAAGAIEKIFQPKTTEKWGVWLVNKDRYCLLLIDSGEVRNYAEFRFKGESEYSILNIIKSDSLVDSVISELNSLRAFHNNAIGTLDKVYFYSNEVDSDFFKMLLTYEVENLRIVDPFKIMRPVNFYQSDANESGAICQYTAIMGLIMRRIPEGQI